MSNVWNFKFNVNLALSWQDNSFRASHLDATGFYRLLPNVYLDLCFAVAAVAADVVWRVPYLRSHLLINKLLWLSLLVDPVNFISSRDDRISCRYLRLPSHDLTVWLLWTDLTHSFSQL